jgi:hypothetical protein
MLAVSVSEMEWTLVAEMTDNAAPRHSGQWKKGQSGNPAGMPKGTRHRATMLAEKLMEDDAENIVRAVVNAAKAGDPTAMRLCVERGLCHCARAGLSYSICRRLKRLLTSPGPSAS